MPDQSTVFDQTFKDSLDLRGRSQKIEIFGNLPFVFLHLGCLLVFWVGWSWPAIIVGFVFLIVRMFGLTAGYHRYFSHRSFKTSRAFQFVLAILGACSFQKDPMWWAAHHRHHHRHADTELDSHPPGIYGFLWAHMGWVMVKKNANLVPHELVPDLAKYPELCFLNKYQKTPAFIMLGILTLIGFLLERLYPESGVTLGQVVVWTFFVSTIILHHVTFLVNSVAHLYGSRRFETKDNSRNNWIVALLTMGEGWHNNHHQFPSSERQGLYWWEIDMTHTLLKILSWLGIVWDLNAPSKESLRKHNTANVRS